MSGTGEQELFRNMNLIFCAGVCERQDFRSVFVPAVFFVPYGLMGWDSIPMVVVISMLCRAVFEIRRSYRCRRQTGVKGSIELVLPLTPKCASRQTKEEGRYMVRLCVLSWWYRRYTILSEVRRNKFSRSYGVVVGCPKHRDYAADCDRGAV